MRYGSSLLAIALTSCAMAPSVRAVDLLATDTAIVDAGHGLYRQHCAKCHGDDAKGGTAEVPAGAVKAPSLTGLAKKNAGTFPFWELYEMISGAELLPAHRERAMPIWSEALAKAPKMAKADAKSVVRGRITAILAYLSTVQEK